MSLVTRVYCDKIAEDYTVFTGKQTDALSVCGISLTTKFEGNLLSFYYSFMRPEQKVCLYFSKAYT